MVSRASSANIIKKERRQTTFNSFIKSLNRYKLNRNKQKNKQFRKKTIAFGSPVFCYSIKHTYYLNKENINTKVFSMVVCVDNTRYSLEQFPFIKI